MKVGSMVYDGFMHKKILPEIDKHVVILHVNYVSLTDKMSAWSAVSWWWWTREM